MAWYHWAVVILVILAWYQYTYPGKADNILKIAFDPVNDFIGGKVNLNNQEDAAPTTCPDTVEPVCGSDGVTYDNICKATLADILQVTPGAC